MVFTICGEGNACGRGRLAVSTTKSKELEAPEYNQAVDQSYQSDDVTTGSAEHIWQESVDVEQVKPIVDVEPGPRLPTVDFAGTSDSLSSSKTPNGTSSVPLDSKLDDQLHGVKISAEVKKALEILDSLSISNAVRTVEVLANRRPPFLRLLRASPLFNSDIDTPKSPTETSDEGSLKASAPKKIGNASWEIGTPSEKSNGKESDSLVESSSVGLGSLNKATIPGGRTMRKSIAMATMPEGLQGPKKEISGIPRIDSGIPRIDSGMTRRSSENSLLPSRTTVTAVNFNKANNTFTAQNMGTGGILQFSCPVYFCKVGEDESMIVDVTRFGSAKDQCSCQYETQNASAKAGKRYVAQSGELVFEPGDIMKQICVPILKDSSWNATLEFKIVISNPDNCLLGKYLHTARVKIIDNEIFPTDKYRQKIMCRDFESITHFGLLKEYLKMNFRSSKRVRIATAKTLAVDQLKNLHIVLRVVILKDLVDKIFLGTCKPGDNVIGFLGCPDEAGSWTTEDGRTYNQLLLHLAVVFICPLFLVHLTDHMKVYWKLVDKSAEHLQGNLIRKYLNYDDASRKQLNQSDLMQAIMQDIPNLIENGLLQKFVIAMHVSRLVLFFILQVHLGAYLPAAPCLVTPLLLLGILAIRRRKKRRVLTLMTKNQREIVKWISWLSDGFRLIADYMKRPEAVEQCESRIYENNRTRRNATAVLLNNEYVEVWLATMLLGAWIFVGGNWILNRETGEFFSMTIGEYLLHMEIFREAGESWRAIHVAKRNIEGSLPSLARIVRFMNLPIDLEKRMRLNRRRRQLGEQARKRARGGRTTLPKGVYAADLVPIQLEGVGYRYENSSWDFDDMVAQGAEHSEGSLQDCTLEFPQGILVAVVGLPGQGKSTLLKLIGGVLIPDRGNLMVPPHLRALHISEEPLFFKGSLWDNLTYGVNRNDPVDSDPERVKSICRRLGVHERFCVFLDPRNESVFKHQADWSELLGMTQRTLLNLARAFVANPEILVLHKPTLFFDDHLTQNTYATLREYVEFKGLEMDPAMLEHRRPRTCVVTTVRAGGAQLADKVLCVTPTGVLVKDAKDVTYAELL